MHSDIKIGTVEFFCEEVTVRFYFEGTYLRTLVKPGLGISCKSGILQFICTCHQLIYKNKFMLMYSVGTDRMTNNLKHTL